MPQSLEPWEPSTCFCCVVYASEDDSGLCYLFFTLLWSFPSFCLPVPEVQAITISTWCVHMESKLRTFCLQGRGLSPGPFHISLQSRIPNSFVYQLFTWERKQEYMCTPWHTCEFERIAFRSHVPFYHMGQRNQNQVTRFCIQVLYALNHLNTLPFIIILTVRNF